MTWKKVAEDKDLIILEKGFKDFKVKIEARSDGDKWKIYKTYLINDKSNLVSEYSYNSFDEVKKKIQDLKKEKIYSLEEIRKIKSFDPTDVKVNLRRVYKEDFIEKWFVRLSDKDEKNFIIVRYDSEIKIDFVINERYRILQDEINRQVEEKLGLREFSDNIHYNTYYYTEHNEKSMSSRTTEPYLFGEIDIQFEFDDEN